MKKTVLGTVNNDSQILEIAEAYYEKMELVHNKTIDMDKIEGLKYYKKQMHENKCTKFTTHLPDWLKICIEHNDAINIKYIKDNKRKNIDIKEIK